MKVLFSITLLLAMIVQTFNQAVVMADFYWHQQQIEQELCENKAKPELSCKGKCQLKKELEKENKKEIPQQLQEIKLFLRSEIFALNLMHLLREQDHHPVKNDSRIFTFTASIFHPPLS